MNSESQERTAGSKQNQKNTNLLPFYYLDSYGYVQIVYAENVFAASKLILEQKNDH
ncbi:hypothetical protein KJ840_04530 [Patescibacteria group bacterium]|nr:hypothetical protein [Patescibacteria group bacterium]